MQIHIAGLQAALGTMLALFHKETTGKGRMVDISMLDGLVSLLGFSIAEAKLDGIKTQRWGTSDRFQYSKAFPSSDGSVFMGAYINALEKKWIEFTKLIGKSEWGKSDSPFFTTEGRFENREILDNAIAEWTIKHTKEEAFQLLQQKGVASSPVNNLEEVINNPQIKHREMIQNLTIGDIDVPVSGLAIKLPGDSIKEFTVPPTLSEHSEEILSQLGYSVKEIEVLLENNIVRV